MKSQSNKMSVNLIVEFCVNGEEKASIIPFKVRAWLDLKKRKESQEHIKTGDIKKHKNDVFRLLTTLLPSTMIILPDESKVDVDQLILE